MTTLEDWLQQSTTSSNVPLKVVDRVVIASLVVMVQGLGDPLHLNKVNVEYVAVPLGPRLAGRVDDNLSGN